MKAKMTDIARAAGVSLSTVGRALHGGYVSEDKRARIESAVREMGYIPNMAASGLKSNKSLLIGHLLQYKPNQLYVKIAGGIEHSAAKNGFSVMALTMYSDGEGEALLNELRGRGVDGIVITSNTSIDPNAVKKLIDSGMPVVMVERSFLLPGMDSVLVNDRGGAKTAVASLARAGRRRVGYVGCRPTVSYVERDRYLGYEDALREAALEIAHGLIHFTKNYGDDDGYAAAKALFEGGARPDALFCASDILAAGAMQYLYERGVRVPGDVSVIGYDDTISSYLSPRISSVALDIAAIGDKTLEMLISRRENPDRADISAYVDTIFMNRNS